MGSLLPQPYQLPFASLHKHSPSLAVGELEQGSLALQTQNCNSLLIPQKSTFAGEIFVSLFISIKEKKSHAKHFKIKNIIHI